jgi:glycosyltransferase involved in cell wall biosynthesis
MDSRNIGPDHYSIFSVAAAEVPSYLAAADAGLSFIKRCESKVASSPTKNGEYLACGLPLILNAGIGDSDSLINDWKAGVLIEEFNERAYGDAAAAIQTWVGSPDARSKARRVAEELFDLNAVAAERYASLYERVLNSQ